MTFREVYDEHFGLVRRSLRRLGVPERDVADAVQDVFLVVHRRLGDFEGRSNVRTWVFGICMKVAASRRRAAHVRREIAEAEPREVADDAADATIQLDRKKGLALIESILDELPLEQRAAFVLFELEGMDGEQIAELLDVPVGTVRSRIRLAREAIRERLLRMTARQQFRLQAGRA
jgi:RNA polymerase sigma-70 factor (ECF subfamily)